MQPDFDLKCTDENIGDIKSENLDPRGAWILVGPDCAHSTDVCVEDASDYPLETGVTYATCTWQDAEHVTE